MCHNFIDKTRKFWNENYAFGMNWNTGREKNREVDETSPADLQDTVKMTKVQKLSQMSNGLLCMYWGSPQPLLLTVGEPD